MKLRKHFTVSLLILPLSSGLSPLMAQTLPTNFTKILTFTSPFAVPATIAQNFFSPGQPNFDYAQNPSSSTPAWPGISSIGSSRFLILSINGQRNLDVVTTNIITTRNPENTNQIITTTNTETNRGLRPYGGLFVFAMNPSTRMVSSAVPVYQNTNGQFFYGDGTWNMTNGFSLSYNQVKTITNRVVGTNFSGHGETNTTIYRDDYGIYHSLILFTTNNGATWTTNSVAGSGVSNYLSDNTTLNPDLTNNYRAVTRWIPSVVGGVTNRRIVCDVYRFP